MTYVPVYGPCCKIVCVKAMPYRDTALEEFSHDYTFAPINLPTTETQWTSFVNNIRLQEVQIYPPTTVWHRAYGYDSNDPHAAHVFVHDWQALGDIANGTFVAATTDVRGAGDQASCMQWRSSQKSIKGKPIYFRKYHHEPYIQAGGGDSLATDYVTVLDTYVQHFDTYLGGFYSTKYPTGTTVGSTVLPYVTTRTLKRRGKRPRPSP